MLQKSTPSLSMGCPLFTSFDLPMTNILNLLPLDGGGLRWGWFWKFLASIDPPIPTFPRRGEGVTMNNLWVMDSSMREGWGEGET